jgi:hypothetical protein
MLLKMPGTVWNATCSGYDERNAAKMTEAIQKYTLESLLPVIRSFPAAGTTSLDRLQDGLAVYRDRFALFETKDPRELPEEPWGAEGWKFIKGASKVRKAEIVSLDGIVQIYASNRKRFGCWLLGSREEGREFRLYLRDGRVGRWFVPESDAEGVRAALALLLGDRFIDDAALPHWSRGRAGRLGRRPGSPAIWTLVLLFVAVLLVSPFVNSALSWNPWPQGSWISEFSKGARDEYNNFRGTVASKDSGEVAEYMGALYSELMLQNSVAVPAFVILFVAFPGAVFLSVYCWTTGVLLISWPLRLWSKARARQTDLRRRLKRERRKAAKTTDLSARHRLPALLAGWVLKLAGAWVILAGLVFGTLAGFGQSAFPKVEDIRTIPGGTRVGVLLIGALLIYYGHRLAQRDGRRALVGDQRAPIVYLRPFAADGRNNFNPSGLLAQLLGLEPFGFLRAFGPLGNINPLRLARLFFGRAGEHSEEQMAQFFRRYGPFVAIGKPGELIPQTGALRLYVGDKEWQVTADELLSRAGMVVLQPSDSEGIRWEVERALTTVAPQKVLLCLQFFDGRQGRYDQFRIWVQERVGVKLPRSLGDTMFIFFDCDWQAKRLRLCERLPVFWPISSCAISFKQTLAPFLASVGGDRSQRQLRPATRVSRAFWSVTAVVTWLFVLALPGLLVDMFDVCLKMEGIETLHESKDRQWAWRLPSLWRPLQPEKSDTTPKFSRIEDRVESQIGLTILEKAKFTSPQRFADAWEANVQRKFTNLVRAGRRQVSSGGLEWLETEYGATSQAVNIRVITRAAIAGQKVVFLWGTYAELSQGGNWALHSHMVEALDGFSWKTQSTNPKPDVEPRTTIATPTAAQ